MAKTTEPIVLALLAVWRNGTRLSHWCYWLRRDGTPSFAYTQNPATELVAVMDVNTESAKRLSDEFSVSAVYTDYNQMLEKEALDIVSITTWQGVRAEITVAAAKAGVKGILGEKPMAASLGEADTMIAVCEEHGAKLVIGHNGRFNPANTEIRRLIQDGAIGQPTRCSIGGQSRMQVCSISVHTPSMGCDIICRTRKRFG